MQSDKELPGVDVLTRLPKTVRALYKASSDEEVLALLAEITAFVKGMETPSFLRREMGWLAGTAWVHARSLRNAQAFPLMAASLGLLELCVQDEASKQELQRDREVMRHLLQRRDANR
ncbi:g2272 [Coccomyxa viridis]|uniref:G2272 protein n=1 Tax=Coccomyxa viridis TaxID=1274662 RepID=A0ABP1FRZ0_9CHLO